MIIFNKYRVKPIQSDYKNLDTVYAVQRKIFIWWTIKYFKTYRGADLWIDLNVMV